MLGQEVRVYEKLLDALFEKSVNEDILLEILKIIP
jgi:hypothetical protein